MSYEHYEYLLISFIFAKNDLKSCCLFNERNLQLSIPSAKHDLGSCFESVQRVSQENHMHTTSFSHMKIDQQGKNSV